jgi:hypothetical protein
MHPVDRDDVKRFITPYLALDSEEEEWRDGRFQIKEGATQRDSKERVASIRWSEKGGSGPRPVRAVLEELEEAVDLLTGEAHDRIWLVAFRRGENNPSSWHKAADADGQGPGHHSTEMEAALSDRMRRSQHGSEALAIANARVTMALSDANLTWQERYHTVLMELAITKAELSNKEMLLAGALSLEAAGGRNEQADRLMELLRTFEPHIGPVIAQAAVSMMPGDLPKEPGPRADHHLKAIKANLIAVAALLQGAPELFTAERQAAVAELIQMVSGWGAAAAPDPGETGG